MDDITLHPTMTQFLIAPFTISRRIVISHNTLLIHAVWLLSLARCWTTLRDDIARFLHPLCRKSVCPGQAAWPSMPTPISYLISVYMPRLIVILKMVKQRYLLVCKLFAGHAYRVCPPLPRANIRRGTIHNRQSMRYSLGAYYEYKRCSVIRMDEESGTQCGLNVLGTSEAM